MVHQHRLPRVLVIDDLTGRQLPGGSNPDRIGFCEQFSLVDETPDGQGSSATVPNPIARATFLRGQTPVCAGVGDLVENKLHPVFEAVRDGVLSFPEDRWSLVLLDWRFDIGRVTANSDRQRPGMPPAHSSVQEQFGKEVLKHLTSNFPFLPVVICSGEHRTANFETDYSALGAKGFLSKGDLDEVLGNLIYDWGLIPDQVSGTDLPVVGQSQILLNALRLARRAALLCADEVDRGRSSCLLIRGETGTGKELFTKYVRRQTERARRAWKGRAWVTVNAAALSESLAASLLQGIEDRVATNVKKSLGYIETAHRGDLFLDEIGDTSIEGQLQLLRCLREGEVQIVGGSTVKKVSVRFLFATNADLERKVAEGELRKDFVARITSRNVIHLPPLRERLDDLPFLVPALISRMPLGPREVLPETYDCLKVYGWPGNVAELEGVIWRALSFADVPKLAPCHVEAAFAAIRKEQGLPSQASLPAVSAPVFAGPRKSPISASDLATTVALLLDPSHEVVNWRDLPIDQLDRMDAVLRGRLADIVAVLAAWTYSRCSDANGAARYMLGEDLTSAASQQQVMRLLKLCKKVCERIATMPGLEQKGKLRDLLENAKKTLEKRPSVKPPMSRGIRGRKRT
jgi:DNA-binding NtrC family response regulator